MRLYLEDIQNREKEFVVKPKPNKRFTDPSDDGYLTEEEYNETIAIKKVKPVYVVDLFIDGTKWRNCEVKECYIYPDNSKTFFYESDYIKGYYAKLYYGGFWDPDHKYYCQTDLFFEHAFKQENPKEIYMSNGFLHSVVSHENFAVFDNITEAKEYIKKLRNNSPQEVKFLTNQLNDIDEKIKKLTDERNSILEKLNKKISRE